MNETSPARSTVIRQVRLPGGPDGDHDVLIDGSHRIRVAPTGAVPVPARAAVVDAEGRYCLPGLWDEHTHMVQWALAMSRLDLSGAGSAAQVVDLVRGALPAPAVVGYGFRDAPWPDVPTRQALDQAAGSTPVVLVSGDLHGAWVNRAGAEVLQVSVGPEGMVREGVWFEAMPRLDRATISGAEEALARALPLLPARGVVGVVDVEWADNIMHWQARMGGAMAHGEWGAAVPALVRVEAGFYPDHLEVVLAEGWRTGRVVPGTDGLLSVGRLKILSDGSLNTRTALCRDPYLGTAQVDRAPGGGYGYREYDAVQIEHLVRRAAASGIEAMVHAIGDLAVSAALDAFEAAGTGGRIEHAQLIDPRDQARFATLDVVASVQPEHAMDDRDLVDQYWPDRATWCFPLADLHRAGATIRFGSDAPVAPLDPWAAVSAAVTRSRDGRQAWHPAQALAPEVALAASARGRWKISDGDVADLVLTESDPLSADGDTLRHMPVWATMLAGRWTHGPA